MALCTLYTNLGMEAIQYGVSLTESKVIITSQELLPKVASCLDQLPTVSQVVVFEEPWRGPLPTSLNEINSNLSHQVQMTAYSQVIKMGQLKASLKVGDKGADTDLLDAQPVSEDPAIIMFTSGSTGVPKGTQWLIEHVTL